jgi:SOS-response transcriptional repressor LexA
MNEPLTVRQTQILTMLRDSITAKGYPPSIREIGVAVGLSSNSSVSSQLQQLEEKGFIRRDPNRPRTLTILDPTETAPGAVVAERARIRDRIGARKSCCVVGSENCEYCAGLDQALQIVGGE